MGLQACVFSTPLGWLGLAGQDRCVWRLVIGHRRAEEAWASLRHHFGHEPLAESNWYPALKKSLRGLDLSLTSSTRAAMVCASPHPH